MIQLVPQLRILLACKPIDFRNGIDGLAALCKRELAEDPFSGALFVFRNRRGTALKMLCYDGVGFYLFTRRFSQGRIRWWPEDQDAPLHPLEAQQLSVLLYNRLPKGEKLIPAPPLRLPAIRILHLAPHAHSSTADMPPDWRALRTCCASAPTNTPTRPRCSIDMSRSNSARSLPPTPHVRFCRRARSSSTTPRA